MNQQGNLIDAQKQTRFTKNQKRTMNKENCLRYTQNSTICSSFQK